MLTNLIITYSTLQWVAFVLFIVSLLLVAGAIWKLFLLITGKGDRKNTAIVALLLFTAAALLFYGSLVVYNMGSVGVQM